jgi:hypothetical protein
MIRIGLGQGYGGEAEVIQHSARDNTALTLPWPEPKPT